MAVCRPTTTAMAMAMADATAEHVQPSLHRLLDAAEIYPKPEGSQFFYGTAGFRAQAHLLPSVVFRTAVLAALRSAKTRSAIGLVVTASHNPIKDNGVKVADPSGGMLCMDWEKYADRLVNAQTSLALCELVGEIADREGIALGNTTGRILVGRDTRPSGMELVDAAKKGISALSGIEVLDMGVVSTPQLHWMVRATNRGEPATEDDYFAAILSGYRELAHLKPIRDARQDPFLVDGSNGVGAAKLIDLQRHAGVSSLPFEVRNKGEEGDGPLNDGVGADFVQKERLLPANFSEQDIGKRCVSVDGDADRLVYFYVEKNQKSDCPGGQMAVHGDYLGRSLMLQLLDGDKIAVLAALFISQQLEELGAEDDGNGGKNVVGYGTVRVGVVQTAYANGASTKYIKEVLGLEVAVTPTGVKHLHKKAVGYDIGIYFEANGHGMVLFGASFLAWLNEKQASSDCCHQGRDGFITGQKDEAAIARLVALSKLVNQAIGDALSGILLVESILQYRQSGLHEWNTLYKDLPSRQSKVTVPDRRQIVTKDAETKVASPAILQQLIDLEIVKYKNGRAFVRPSGTEDIVRVYAEAEQQTDADALANAIALHIQSVLG